jgi:hypothetical protein
MDLYSRSFVSIRGYLILRPRSSAVAVGVCLGLVPTVLARPHWLSGSTL